MKKKLLAGLVLSTLALTAFSACVKKEEVKLLWKKQRRNILILQEKP